MRYSANANALSKTLLQDLECFIGFKFAQSKSAWCVAHCCSVSQKITLKYAHLYKLVLFVTRNTVNLVLRAQFMPSHLRHLEGKFQIHRGQNLSYLALFQSVDTPLRGIVLYLTMQLYEQLGISERSNDYKLIISGMSYGTLASLYTILSGKHDISGSYLLLHPC